MLGINRSGWIVVAIIVALTIWATLAIERYESDPHRTVLIARTSLSGGEGWQAWHKVQDLMSERIGNGDSDINEALIWVIGHAPKKSIRDHEAFALLEKNQPTIEELKRALEASMENRADRTLPPFSEMKRAIFHHEDCTFSYAWNYSIDKDRSVSAATIWDTLNSRYPDSLTDWHIVMIAQRLDNDFVYPKVIDELISRQADPRLFVHAFKNEFYGHRYAQRIIQHLDSTYGTTDC